MNHKNKNITTLFVNNVAQLTAYLANATKNITYNLINLHLIRV